MPITISYAGQIVLLNAMVDTGSAGTAADVNRFRIDFRREARICELLGIGGRQKVIVQDVESIAVGDVACADFAVEFCDMDEGYDIEAIVGGDLLDRLGAIIDYPNCELRLSACI